MQSPTYFSLTMKCEYISSHTLKGICMCRLVFLAALSQGVCLILNLTFTRFWIVVVDNYAGDIKDNSFSCSGERLS